MTRRSNYRQVFLVLTAFAFALALRAQTKDSGNLEPLPTIRASARAVVVDVVVTTPAGEVVKNLPAASFHVNEDGAPQTISSFEEHGSESNLAAGSAALAARNAEAAPSAVTNVLLLDALNTERIDQGRVRAQVVSYLKALPAGTSLSIFALESKLRLVHGPSADSGVLLAAVEDKKTGVMPGTASASRRTQDEADARQDEEFLKSMNSAPPGAVAAVQQAEADHGAYQGDKRISMTLDALDELGRFLARIPGRKNLIWFSGSFPIALVPDPGVQVSSRAAEQSRRIKETNNLLTVARIAVYPVNAAGVATGAANDASDHFTASSTDQAAQSGSLAAGASAMRQIASETGGEAFGDSNNLAASLARAIANRDSAGSINSAVRIRRPSPRRSEIPPRFSRVTAKIHPIFIRLKLHIPSGPCILKLMITIDEREESAEMVEEQVELLAHSHPCEVCGAESRYLWTERRMRRQACERCAPAYMKLRAA